MPIFIEDLSMVYRDPRTLQEVCALQEISLVVEDREFVTLVGPSGCGKTTLIRLIAGFGRPTEGRIRIDRTSTDRPATSMVWQENALFPWRWSSQLLPARLSESVLLSEPKGESLRLGRIGW